MGSFCAQGLTRVASTDAWFTYDLRVKYRVRDGNILGGISNLTDEMPPVLGNGVSFSRLGTYPFSSQYYEDVLGRQFFVRLSKEF